MESAIIVHGGAGAWRIGSGRLQEAIDVCQEAAAAGQRILMVGGTALEAVETAVRILEDHPAFDAGRGSYVNTKGEVEVDAMIMDGRHLHIGAVAAVKRVKNPITLARLVMEQTDHNFLVGEGAEEFADSINFPRCEMAELIVLEDDEAAEIVREPGALGDTVGAVALDSHGNLATATSTGGTKGKMPGRVGDSPLVGSGGYADNWSAGASATGHGEALMKIVISKRVCDFVANGLSAQAACEAAMRLLEERLNGHGGLIAIDARGRIGFSYNTTAMPYAYAIGDQKVVGGQ